MVKRPPIECEVHDLLDEANVMLLMHAEASPLTDDLIKRLRNRAEQAMAAGRPDVTQRLNRAAELLETKLQGSPSV